MFGGIPESFYTTYHEHRPKSEPRDQYDLRQELYQLYHYLNHTVLFGVRHVSQVSWTIANDFMLQGAYASSARSKIEILLRAFPAKPE